MLHLFLHLAVPLALAVVVYRPEALRAGIIMVATMAVDLDHLLADPVYDPDRCSIGFHPLHTGPTIVVYTLAFAATLLLARRLIAAGFGAATRVVHLGTLGLLIHMALDWGDCVI